MTKKILIPILLLIAVPYHQLFAQSKKEKLYESFTNNYKGWPSNSDANVSAYIYSGNYHIDHREDGFGRSYTINIKLNQKKDFEIKAAIEKVSGVDNNGFGLVWGSKGYDYANYFLISSNGHYLIYKEEADERIFIRDWAYSSSINQGDGATNRLAIIKQGSKLRFYINDNLVESTSFQPFFGKEFGFRVNYTMHIAVDFLKINYLD